MLALRRHPPAIARENRVLLPWMLAISIFTCSLLGCDRRAGPALTVSDPKTELKWIMQRLASAIQIYPPSGGSGLHIKREMRFEYQAPDALRANPTAVVIIDTSTAYLYERPSRQQPEDSLKSSEANAPLSPGISADPLADPDAEFLDDIYPAPTLKQTPTTTAPVPELHKQESATFHLIYMHDQWQLEQEPESDLDRQFFKYALGH